MSSTSPNGDGERGSTAGSAAPGAAAPADAHRPAQITRLLESAAADGRGMSSITDALLPLVYDELRALAGSLFRGQRGDHTLQPTALVHEAYARLVKAQAPQDGSSAAQWTGRAHFFAVAAKAMRQVLANHARDRRRAKRGGGWQRITLSEAVAPAIGGSLHAARSGESGGFDLVALDEALEALHALDERQARIVELRFFAEMTMEEIAHVLEVSTSTVEREWRMARAWLSGRLRDA